MRRVGERSRSKKFGTVAGFALVALVGQAAAVDVGIDATKLIIVDKTSVVGKAKVVA